MNEEEAEFDKKTARKLNEIDVLKIENAQLKIAPQVRAQTKILKEYGISINQVKPDGTIMRGQPIVPQDHKKKQR